MAGFHCTFINGKSVIQSGFSSEIIFNPTLVDKLLIQVCCNFVTRWRLYVCRCLVGVLF